jgi:tetratricopeptide (TPR) repeat protein
MQNITIAVSEAGTFAARTYAYKILVEGNIAAQRTLTPVQTQQIQEMVSQYFTLMQGVGREASKSYLHILSDGLFHLFFEESWQELGEMILPNARLTVASSIPQVLQLPWELLHLSRHKGASNINSIIRLPRAADRLAASVMKLSPGPLRVLFLAAEPMDYEDEELSILQVAEGLDMSLAICENGSLEELKGLAKSFRPHLLHITCRPDLRSAEELAAALKDAGLLGIILGGRQNESASSQHLLCQRLAESIPLALAWNAPTYAARPLYSALAAGKSMDEAILSFRRENAVSTDQVPVSIPALYSIYDQPGIFDTQKRASAKAPICRELTALPGLTEGRADCFVGRRRDLQILAAALREGRTQALIITGPVGIGKSTLANRIARLLAADGYSILPIYSSQYNRISAARLLEAAAGHLIGIGEENAAKELKDPGRSVGERLQKLMDVLKASRILMIWDGLDMDGKTYKISDPDLAGFYMQMIKGMTEGRTIITSPTLPSDARTLPSHARQWKLEGLGRAAFIRYLLRDEAAANRYRKGEITYVRLVELHNSCQGHPASLAQMSWALSHEDHAADDDSTTKLALRLSAASGRALSLAAVYAVAMSQEGLAAVSGLTEEQAAVNAREWQNLSLASPTGKLWSVPSILRPPLLATLNSEEQRAAEKAAGKFLGELAKAGRSSELGLSRLDVLLEARGHLLAAHDWSDAVAVTSHISSYLHRRGCYSEIIRLNRELSDGMDKPTAEPNAWIARAYLDQGEYNKAQEWYEQLLQIAPDAAAHLGLGIALMHQEKNDEARASLQKAADAFHFAGGLSGEAAALQEMARLDMGRNDYDAARTGLVRAKGLLESARDRTGAAFAVFNLASFDLEKGDFQQAGAEFAKALPLFREIKDSAGVAAILHNLGMIHSQAGEKEKAIESFCEALQINQELADKPAEAGAFFQLGAIAVQHEKMHEGLRLMVLAAIVLRSIKSDEVKNVEPLAEKLAAQLLYTQEQFMAMVQEVVQGYANDRGFGLVERACGK